MSLINNMLLDLDKNSSTDHTHAISITDGLNAATNVPRQRSRKKSSRWPAIVSLCVLLIFTSLWWGQKYQPQILDIITSWPATLENVLQQNLNSDVDAPAIAKISNTTAKQAVIRNQTTTPAVTLKQAAIFQPKVIPVKKQKASTAKAPTTKTKTIKSKANNPKTAVANVIITPAKPDPIQMAAYHYAEATHQLAKQQLPLALASLRKALKLNPKHIKARSVLAQKLTNLQQHKEAELLLRTGISLLPQHYQFSQLLAKLMISQGKHESALVILKRRLNDRQNTIRADAEYLALLAMQYQKLQQHDEAIKIFNQALKIQPQKNTWWLGLAISLEALQQQTLARKAYLRAATGKQLPIRLQKFTVEKIALLNKK